MKIRIEKDCQLRPQALLTEICFYVVLVAETSYVTVSLPFHYASVTPRFSLLPIGLWEQ